jgi:ABC-type branched-subunit amino acid transport system substrate-binding protein
VSFGLRFLVPWLLLAPLAAAASASQVTLGLVLPPSEPNATGLLRGVQLAVADANESGEALVGLEVQGDEGQWGTAGNDAVILLSERHVDAIISPSDGATSHLILQVSGRTQVPVASLCPDSSVTNTGVLWAIRVVPRTDLEAMALFCAARRPDRSPLHWWAVVPTGRPGRGVRRDLKKAAHDTSTQLEQILDACESRSDLDAQVHLIVAAAPGGVLIWLPPAQAGALAAALRAAGYQGPLAGPSPLDSPDFIAAAGSAADGVRITSFREDADFRARAEAFETLFQRRYGSMPDFAAAAAYDAARVLIETLRRSEKGEGDRQFPLTRPIAGVTGLLHFDNLGNRTDALQVTICKAGRFVPLPSDDTKL